MKLANKLYNFYKRHDTAILRVLALVFYCLCLPILTEWVVRGNFKEAFEWAVDRFPAYMFTSIFFYFLCFFLFTLFRRIDFPILIVSVLSFGLGAASYFKNSYRSEPLYPWDLGIISEAADISSEMDLTPTAAMFIAGAFILAVFLLLLGLHIFLFKKGIFKKHKRSKKRKAGLALQVFASLAVLVCYTLFVLNNTALMEAFGIAESAFRQPQAYRNRKGRSGRS